MNFQTSKRIMCCLMAALILCCAVVRPIEASATAIVPALSTVAGVSSEFVIPAVLAALGIGFASQHDCLDFMEQVSNALPDELILTSLGLANGYFPYVKTITYDDVTYLSHSLVDFVLKYLTVPTDGTEPVLKATGYELTSTFQDIYNEAIAVNPSYADIASAYKYCYTYSTGSTGTIIYTDNPVTYENKSDGSSLVKTTGSFLRLVKNGASAVIDTYKPDNTGTITGKYNIPVLSFGLAAMTGLAVNSLVKIVGNLAPDLEDDEDYKAWLERQKFFVIQPDNDGDGEGDNDGDGDPSPQPYVPVRLLDNVYGNNVQSQDEAQSGANSVRPPRWQYVPEVVTPSADPNPQPDPDPNPDPNPLPDPQPNPGDSPAIEPDIGPGDSGADIPDWLRLIYQALVNIMLNIIVQIEQLQYLPGKIANAFEYLFGNIQIWLYEQIAALEAVAQWIGDKIDLIGQELVLLPAKIEIFFTELGARIETAFQWIWEHLAAAFETLGSIITTAFEWIWEHLAIAFQNVIDTLNTFWQNLKNWMQAMADYLLNGLKALFIPQKGYMDAKIAEMRGKFGIVDSALNTFDGVRSFFFSLGSKPPVIYIDLGAATGSYYFGGETIFVDMRWYADYKPTMDLVLSAILWLWFVWRFMIALPGIIQGFSGYVPQNNGQTETGMVLASQWYER